MHVKGFTLIELSIALVIIGLIVGGVLVGQDLIKAAAVRAQISQIEKYNAAVNTFKGKYGYLPGDIPNPYAAQFSFAGRGPYAGEGDGNGVIEGIGSNAANSNSGVLPLTGEAAMFWVDLSQIGLIEGKFTVATPIAVPPGTITTSQYFPASKIGNGGYVYVWSGGWQNMANYLYGSTAPKDGQNYFGLAMVNGNYGAGALSGMPLLTAAQAYTIDKKMDDGYPQSGNVMAMDVSGDGWAAGGPGTGTPPYEPNYGDYNSGNYGPVLLAGSIGDSMPAGPLSCYDGSKGLPEQYSIQVSGGAGVNCVLSFRFQ